MDSYPYGRTDSSADYAYLNIPNHTELKTLENGAIDPRTRITSRATDPTAPARKPVMMPVMVVMVVMVVMMPVMVPVMG